MFVDASKVIIEAALNEQCTRARNPHVPLGPEECANDALAAAEAGAAVVHFHIRDPKTGRGLMDAELYADALRRINDERPDLLVRTPYHHAETAAERFGHVAALADDPTTHLRAAMIDPGTVIFSFVDPSGQIVGDHTFTVSNEHFRHFLQLCDERKLQNAIVVREPGHVRLAVAAHRAGWMTGTMFLHIHLSDNALWGVPPSNDAFDVYTSLVPEDIPFTYSSYTNGPSHWAMNRVALEQGAHVRVGIGDHAIEEDGSTPTNAELVRHAREMASAMGREPASPGEALEILGLGPR
jgi:3-keto-5-aminohexanoate cleavage enzyme